MRVKPGGIDDIHGITRDKSQNRGAMGVAGNFPGLIHTRTGSKWQLMRRSSSCAANGVPWVSHDICIILE